MASHRFDCNRMRSLQPPTVRTYQRQVRDEQERQCQGPYPIEPQEADDALCAPLCEPDDPPSGSAQAPPPSGIRCQICGVMQQDLFSKRARLLARDLAAGIKRSRSEVRCKECTQRYDQETKARQRRLADALAIQCMDCGRSLPLASFSQSQRYKPADARRCPPCAETQKETRALAWRDLQGEGQEAAPPGTPDADLAAPSTPSGGLHRAGGSRGSCTQCRSRSSGRRRGRSLTSRSASTSPHRGDQQ